MRKFLPSASPLHLVFLEWYCRVGQHRGAPPFTGWRSSSSLALDRRLGIGQSAVALILDRFAGLWEVQEYLRNPGAVKFWRHVIADYTRGDYEERVANGEVRQTFRSGPSRMRKG